MQSRRVFICWGMEAPLVKSDNRGQRKKVSPKPSLNLTLAVRLSTHPVMIIVNGSSRHETKP